MIKKMTVIAIHGLILLQTLGGFCASLSDIIKDTEVTGEVKGRTYIINDYDFIKAKEGKDNDYNLSMGKKIEIELGLKTDLAELKAKLEAEEEKFVAGKEEVVTLEDIKKKFEIKNLYIQTEEMSVLGLPISLTAGRFEIGEEYKEFIAYADKIDGFTKSICIHPVGYLNIGVFKLEEIDEIGEPGTTTPWERDESLYGLTLVRDIPEGKINSYLYSRVKETSKTDFSNVVLGGRALGSIPQVPGLSYDVELAMQTSLDLNIDVKPVKHAEGLGVRVKGAYETEMAGGDLRLAAEVIYTSGDKENTKDKNEEFLGVLPSYSPVEFEEIKYLPIARDKKIVGKKVGNLTAVVVNASYKPVAIEGLRLGLAVANYQKTTTKAGEKKNYGNEIDVTVEYTVADNIILGGLLGYFMPGDFYTDQIPKGKDKASAFKCMLEAKLLF